MPQHREPFLAADIRALLDASDAQRWARLEVVSSTGSTNVDLCAAARAGAPDGSVLVASEQTAGRGRLQRDWSSPAGASLSISVLLRPAVPLRRFPWLTLLAGVAVAQAVSATGVAVRLKWPNDVQATDGRKLAGILTEVPEPGAAVIGIGLNVDLTDDELPVPEATSLLLAGAPQESLQRPALVAGVLDALAAWEARWVADEGDPQASGLREAYLRSCRTVGSRVHVLLPGGAVLDGRGMDVDDDGHLIVAEDDSSAVVRVTAGDVVHVR